MIVAAGVGPRSATDTALGAVSVADSMVTVPLGRPITEAAIVPCSDTQEPRASVPMRGGVPHAASSAAPAASDAVVRSLARVVMSVLPSGSIALAGRGKVGAHNERISITGT